MSKVRRASERENIMGSQGHFKFLIATKITRPTFYKSCCYWPFFVVCVKIFFFVHLLLQDAIQARARAHTYTNQNMNYHLLWF